MKIKRNKPTIKLTQLTKAAGDELKKELFKKYKGTCPILKKKIPFDNLYLDHKHKLKGQKAGPNGRGLVRGLIDFRANSLEGIILKKYKKSGLVNEIDLITFLRNLADYLENPQIDFKYIHWTEKVKPPILKKSEYNLIVKYYNVIHPRAKNIPPYPKSGIKKVKGKTKQTRKKVKYRYVAKLTKKWERLLKLANNIHRRKK